MKTIHAFLFAAAALLPACDGSTSATTEEAPAALSAPAAEQEESTAAIKLEFLRVHLRSDHFIAEGVTEVPGYRLAHQALLNEVDGTPLRDKDGNPLTLDYWIETEEAAAANGYYLCEKDIAMVEADPARPEYLYIEFSAEGSRKMQKLTSCFEIGRERLAIVVNGEVCNAPVVQSPLSRQIMLNVFQIHEERDALVRGLKAAIRQQAQQTAPAGQGN